MNGQGSPRFAFHNPEVVFFRHAVERELAAFFRKTKTLELSEIKILDVGCGWGSWLLLFLSWGARAENLWGIDLLPGRVETARCRLPKSDIILGRAEKLPWANDSFDLVFQFTVFSSMVSPQARQEAAAEIWRVLKPAGYFVSLDYSISHPANSHTVGIGKRELGGLFPKAEFHSRRVGLFPPLARRLVPFSSSLAHILEKTRILSAHYLAYTAKK